MLVQASQFIDSEKYTNILKRIANQMLCPQKVKQICIAKENQIPLPILPKPVWDDLALSSGYPGLVLLFVELDKKFPDEKWDLVVHDYILAIKSSLEQGRLANQASIFVGLSGVCFALQQASRNGSRYTSMLNKLNSILVNMVENNYLNRSQINFEKKQPSSPFLYDIIVGLSGIAAYILTNLEFAPFNQLINKIIQHLIKLTDKIIILGEQVDGWYVSANHQLMEREKHTYPNGSFNLGMSHGVAGVLAALSAAYIKGIQLKNHNSAIKKISYWLIQNRIQAPKRKFWPPYISFEEAVLGAEPIKKPIRDAWCYGTPGTSRALQLAGQALNCDSWKKIALDMFQDLFLIEPKDWNIPSPTFCHGLAGLTQLTYSMVINATEEKQAFLIKKHNELTELIFKSFNDKFPFGFQDIETQKNGAKWNMNKAGLLEGVSGTLLALTNPSLKNPSWSIPMYC